jgi:hypothetical protein
MVRTLCLRYCVYPRLNKNSEVCLVFLVLVITKHSTFCASISLPFCGVDCCMVSTGIIRNSNIMLRILVRHTLHKFEYVCVLQLLSALQSLGNSDAENVPRNHTASTRKSRSLRICSTLCYFCRINKQYSF